MNKNILKVLLSVIAVCVMAAIIFRSKSQDTGRAFASLPKLQQAGDALASKGYISKADFDHLSQIQGRIASGTPASLDDINFVLSILKTHNSKTSMSPKDSIARSLSLASLVTITMFDIPSESKGSIYDAVLPCLNGFKGGEAVQSTIILGQLKDKRAVPHLLPNIDSSDGNLKQATQLALRDLGVRDDK